MSDPSGQEDRTDATEDEKTLLDFTVWHKERADPDYDQDSVTHIVEDNTTAEFVEWLLGPSRSDEYLARFRIADVTYEGEQVNCSVEISESLLREAFDDMNKTDNKSETKTSVRD